jgi:hypothetical protein
MARMVRRTCLTVTLLKVKCLSCYSGVGCRDYIAVELRSILYSTSYDIFGIILTSTLKSSIYVILLHYVLHFLVSACFMFYWSIYIVVIIVTIVSVLFTLLYFVLLIFLFVVRNQQQGIKTQLEKLDTEKLYTLHSSPHIIYLLHGAESFLRS